MQSGVKTVLTFFYLSLGCYLQILPTLRSSHLEKVGFHKLNTLVMQTGNQIIYFLKHNKTD